MKKNYKYVIGYLYEDYKIKSLHTMLPKGNVYVKGYDGKMKWMYFLIEDNEKYNTVCDKVSTGIKKELRTCLQQIFLKTKIKSWSLIILA